MEDSSRDRRSRLIARCLEEYETGGEEALDRVCSRHPDLAGEIRASARALRALRGALPGAPGVDPPLPAVGHRLGRFRITEKLGQGGMGVVYRAHDPVLDRAAAVKVLSSARSSSPDALERFRREARALAQVRHPNVVTILDVGGTEDGLPWLAMDLIEGESLEALLGRLREREPASLRGADLRPAGAEGMPLPATSYVEAVVRLTAKVAGALEHTHRLGIVHRDVKPGNILVDRGGEPHLVDFGLARMIGSATLTRSGSAPGTPAYMAPEQVADTKGGVGPRTDIYALGTTLYHALTLRRPFEGGTEGEIYRRILMEDPPRPRRSNATLSRDLETVCLKALEKDPDRRYPTAGAFAEDLLNLLELRPIRARPAGPARRALKFLRRHPAAAAAGAVLLLALSGAGALTLGRQLRLQAHLASGGAALEAGDLARAREEAGRARDIGGRSRNVRDLLDRLAQAEARATAAEAVAEARRRLDGYRELRSSMQAILDRLSARRMEFERAWMPPTERAAYFDDQEELPRLRARSEAMFFALLEALRQATLHEPDHPALPGLHAEAYLEKWREARAAGDEALEEVFRAKVLELDPDGRWREELDGSGTLSITGQPEGAEVHLFRYELQSRIRRGGDRRLVPVPFPAGPEPAPAGAGIQPGDVVLVVHDVAGGSAAERLGIRRGDLIPRMAGAPIEGTVFAFEIQPGGPAEGAGVRPFDRVLRVQETGVREEFDVAAAYTWLRPGEAFEVAFAGEGGEKLARATKGRGFEEDTGFTPFAPDIAWALPVPASGVELGLLLSGVPREVRLPGGAAWGVRLAPTASPLVFSPGNRAGTLPLRALDLPPGSYLAVVRHPGWEDLRLPFRLEHKGNVEIQAEMLPQGRSPRNFVWIPPGRFRAGGDPAANQPWPPGVRKTGGFWIGRSEVTVGEYLAFLNDPETLRAIKAAEAGGRLIHVPRLPDSQRGLWSREGDRYEADRGLSQPIVGISWEDTQAYCEWRTRRAAAQGEDWVFRLPTEEEWEKAARGGDGRHFPWGDFFDWSFCKGAWSRPIREQPEDVMTFVRDESPFGVRDLAGSVMEWCGWWFAWGEDLAVRGGAWAFNRGDDFRAAGRLGLRAHLVTPNTGFRLVAARRGGD